LKEKARMPAVLCYGSLIPDRVLRLPRFPQPGEGVHALSEQLYLGGEPCNVGGHLAAWGADVVLAGNNLGADPLGTFVVEQLRRRERTTWIGRVDPAVQTPTCYIWTTPDGERTIVPSWPTPTGWTLPDAAALGSARLVSASIFGPGMPEMLELARAQKLPIAVADIAGPDDPRLPGAIIVTTSEHVLRARYGVYDGAGWMRAVPPATGAFVVFSAGAGAARALDRDGRRIEALPPTIVPYDTTGAGDALKAGMIHGWLHTWPLDTTLRWALAAASLQCLYPGACERVPSAAEIEPLLSTIGVDVISETG
jgi:sugar/nucleoside kinase (ribokinase family)